MSFWQFTQVIESPPQSDFPGVPTYQYANAPEKVSTPKSLKPSLKPIVSVLQKLLHGRCNVARLGKDHILELRLVRAEGIHCRNAPDRGVQLLEEFVRNTRRDLRAVPPAQHVFVSHKDSVRLSNGGRNGLPVIRRERTQVDDFNGNALALQLRGRDFRPQHHYLRRGGASGGSRGRCTTAP